jgi:hypothetical protein
LTADASLVVDAPGVHDGARQAVGVGREIDHLLVLPEDPAAAATDAGDTDDLLVDIDVQRLAVVVTIQQRKRLNSAAAGPEEGTRNEVRHRRPGGVGEAYDVAQGVERHRRVPAFAAERPQIHDGPVLPEDRPPGADAAHRDAARPGDADRLSVVVDAGGGAGRVAGERR